MALPHLQEVIDLKCKNCSRSIDNDSIYCKWCGTKQLRERKKKDVIKVPKPRQLKSGSWNIQLREEGQSVTEATAALCIAKATAIRAGFLEAKAKVEVITLTKAINRYIEQKDAVLSPETVRTYRGYQHNRFAELMNMDVSKITPTVAQAAVNAETKTKSSKTVHNAWAFVNTVIESVTGQRLDITTAQVVSDERAWLMPTQITEFCKHIAGQPCEIGALLALSSLRRSEIMALTWENIDLVNRVIHIRGAMVYDQDNKLVLKKQNKNKTSRRDVPIMMNQLFAALQRIEDKTGRVVNVAPNTLRNQINRICEVNDLPKVGTHGLRHSFASLSAHLRIPEPVSMEIGGWADSKTMRKIYTHVSKLDIKNSQNDMAKFYNGIFTNEITNA